MISKAREEERDDQAAKAMPPKQVMTLLYKPNHRLFQIAFDADLSAGALAEVWGTLNEMGIKIHSQTMVSADGMVGTFSAFLDSANYGITAKGIRSELEQLGCLRKIKIEGGEEVVVDQMFFPMRDPFGNRVMLITQAAFQAMQKALGTVLGSGEGVVAYHEGLSIGSTYALGVRSMLRGDTRRFLQELSKLFIALGIGDCEFTEINLDRMHFVIELKLNIECEGLTSDGPRSQWLRGMLIGGASSILDTPMDCRETRCVAMGDPCCEFEIFKSEGC